MKECDRAELSDKFPNLMQLTGAYCFNNRSGICKGFSGKFEFLFNTFTDQVLGHIPKHNDYMSTGGWHERVPVSYNIDGEIIYADRSINWATKFTKKNGNNMFSLLSTKEFDWCQYTEKDLWPYKSAIKDPKGRYHIYFFNRQSCIYDKKTGKRRLYNTRFQHNSRILVDSDANPTMFTMEDALTDPPYDIRLVKHRRQEWYEVPFEILVKPSKTEMKYFIRMSQKGLGPSKINASSGPLLTRRAYRHIIQACLADDYQHENFASNINLTLALAFCGFDPSEVVDKNYAFQRANKDTLVRVGHYGHAVSASTTSRFYLPVMNKQSSGSIIFFATTTMPDDNDEFGVHVISLYAKVQGKKVEDIYEEHYPMPVLADYFLHYDSTSNDWSYYGPDKTRDAPDLNYVDDIAYLEMCKTVLVIFGPLYTELPVGQFDTKTKARVGSVSDLSIREQATAFCNVIKKDQKTNKIAVFFRNNWLRLFEYQCGQGGELVTAKESGRMMNLFGRPGDTVQRNTLGSTILEDDIDIRDLYNSDLDVTEEHFWVRLGFTEPSVSEEPPDPKNYDLEDFEDEHPHDEPPTSSWWHYLVMILGVVFILAIVTTLWIKLGKRRTPEDTNETPPRQVLPALASRPAPLGVSPVGPSQKELTNPERRSASSNSEQNRESLSTVLKTSTVSSKTASKIRHKSRRTASKERRKHAAGGQKIKKRKS